MNLKDLLRDTISIVSRTTGTRIDGIKAAVNSEEISILQSEPLIEPGDLIIRAMSNGGQETFEVIDPGFHEQFHTIPAGYRARVKKLGIPEARTAIQSITYNVHGSNARINNYSIDNSTNLVQDSSGDVANLLAELRAAIGAAPLPPSERHEAEEIIDGVEEQFSGNPKRSIVKAMLKALPDVSAIATTVGALISLAN
jgi:hypothetical protein